MDDGATKSDRRRELRGVLLALLGATCWGFSATCVSWLTTRAGMDVLSLANMRMLCTGAAFTAYAFARHREQVMHLVRDRGLVLRLVLHTAVGVLTIQISYMYAIAYTNPATALLLQETGVPFILVLACIGARRLPTRPEAVALVLAVFGIVAISTQGSFTNLAINPAGLAWGLVAGASLAGYNLIPVRLLRECGSIVTNGLAMLLASLVLMPVARPWEAPVALDAMGVFAFVGVVVVGTMVAYGVYLRGVVDAGPVKASLVGVFEPVSGAAFAAVWLGYALSPWDWIGGAAIIAMMVIVALRK